MASYTVYLSNLRTVYIARDENDFCAAFPGADCVILDDSNNEILAPWDMDDQTSAQQSLMSPTPVVTGDTRASMRDNVILGMAIQYPRIDLDTDIVSYLWL